MAKFLSRSPSFAGIKVVVMSFMDSVSLFLMMVALAALPSASVALVVARAATAGIRHGIAVAAGIVVADLAFILLVVFGLALIAEAMGSFFMVVKYLGAGYLVWFGISLLRSRQSVAVEGDTVRRPESILVSFLAGVALTLGDIKAIFFYMSLLPAFISPGELTGADVLLIALLTVVSVGGVKVIYACYAARLSSRYLGQRADNTVRKLTGCMMVGAGGYLIIKP